MANVVAVTWPEPMTPFLMFAHGKNVRSEPGWPSASA